MATPDSGLGTRIQLVILELSVQYGRRITLAEFGRLVADIEGRKKPYTTSTVSGWLHEQSEPTLAVLDAISQLSNRSRAWLAFSE